ncbi:MAG TPA: hypothetical protein IGS37_13850 [Synechococcales cyanobacterium M55_K2018_004]|nr:hypothetical protein [Synechococcales cyanobacterium M55_K2018_004]
MEPIKDNNREYLKLLSIFHYVLGGIVAAFSMFSLVYISIGLSYILSVDQFPQTDGTSPPPEFGWIFLIFGSLFLILGLTFAISLIASGRFLAKRKRYWFGFIVACLSCLFTPFGTILGIFTIVILSQRSVKELYGLNK